MEGFFKLLANADSIFQVGNVHKLLYVVYAF